MFLEKDIESFCSLLSYEEIDALKFTISILSRKEMDDEFSISKDELKRKNFNSYLNILAKIQPFASKVPEFGLLYRGKPHFITANILKKLQNEAEQFRPLAKSALPEKSSQLIYQPMSLLRKC